MSDETKRKMKAGFGAAGAAAGAALAAGVANAMAKDKANRLMAAQMGLSPKEAKRVGKLSGKVWSQGFGESAAQVNDAMRGVMQALGPMSDKALQRSSKSALTLATMTGEDVGRISLVAGQMIQSGLAKNGKQAFDILTKASQGTHQSMQGDLLDVTSEYGTFFGSLGLSGKEAMGMLAAASQTGVIGLDKVGDAMKEFSTLATETDNKAVGSAYKTLGLESDKMAGKILAGGKTARGAFDTIIGRLQGIKNPSKQARTAVALFGTPIEDLNKAEIPAFLSSMSSMDTKLKGVAGTSKDAGRQITSGPAAAFDKLKRSAIQSFTGIANQALPLLQPILGFLRRFTPVLVPMALAVTGLGIAFTVASVGVKAFNMAMKMNPVVRIISLIILGVTALVATVMWAWKNVAWFRDGVTAAWKWIKRAALAVVTWFQTYVLPVLKTVWQGIATVAMWLWKNVIRPAWRGIMVAVRVVVAWFQTYVMPVITKVIRVVGAIFKWLYNNVVKPVFGFIKAYIRVWWTVVSAIFKGVVWFFKNVLGPIFQWLWNSIIKPVFRFAWGAIKAFWMLASGIFKLVVAFIKKVLAPVFVWLWRNIVKPSFAAMGRGISIMWNKVVKPVFRAVWGSIKNTLGPIFKWLYRNVVRPVFNWISDKVGTVWEKGIKPIFNALKHFITKVVPKAFRTGVNAVGKAWDKVKAIAAAPINFVIDTVINDGIIGAYNFVADKLGVDTLPEVDNPLKKNKGRGAAVSGGPMQAFAEGGYTGQGPKYAPKGVVHGGEYVFTKQETQNAGGPGALAAVAKQLRGYAKGGFVWPVSRKFPVTQGPSAAHPAYDIGTPIGTPVSAAASGRVTHAGAGYRAPGVWGGTEVHLGHGGGIGSLYAHLSSLAVRAGQMVKQGQTIARSGNTGISSGPHLHFGGMQGGAHVSPAPFLNGRAVSGKVGHTDGGGWSIVDAMIAGAKKLLSPLVDSVLDKFPGAGSFVDLATGVAKKLVGGTLSWAKDKLGIGGVATGAAMRPAVFDNGGTLGRGLNLVDNQTGRPEPLTPVVGPVGKGGRGGGDSIVNHFAAGAIVVKVEAGPDGKVDEDDLEEKLERIFRKSERRGY